MPDHAVHQTLQAAVAQYQAGSPLAAEVLCRQVLSRQPNNVDALNVLGGCLYLTGKLNEAIEVYQTVAALKPDLAEAHNNLGGCLQCSGRLADAIAAFKTAIELKPDFPVAISNLVAAYLEWGNALSAKGQTDEAVAAFQAVIRLKPGMFEAFNNLGIAQQAKGQLDEAIASFRQAMRLKPDLAEAHNNLGAALKEVGQVDEAIAALRQAIRLKPDLADAHDNLGNALNYKGQLDEAIAAHRHAIQLKPDYPQAYNNLGNTLGAKGQLDQAIAAYRQAIRLKPDYAEAHSNLGNALGDAGQLDEAIASHRQAVRLKPDFAGAHSNLGSSLKNKGQLDEALAAYRQAIALRPNYAEAHTGLSLALLARGDFQRGLQEYEWRWKCKDFPSPRRNFAQPQWDGRLLDGRVLLLHAEQGFGDAIHFIRYLPLVQQRGGRIVIECPSELQRLFQTIAGRCQIVTRGQPLPPFDLHCPILSLPLAFKTTMESIPAEVPYLLADPELVESWRQKLGDSAAGLKIALAWAGNPIVKGDQARSMSLDRLAPLSEAPGATFYSIQKGAAERQADQPPPGLSLVNLASELHDFADTAAVMCAMDLVITTDTSVAHLAGALGRPVWVMLQFMPDWRWFLDRDDSPWYPTMRLFRQTTPGDWLDVIRRVAKLLAKSKRQT
jgi:tetratricopeptide (TPR) repeat protein